MNYEQSLTYLSGLGRFGINLGLVRIETLLKRMGNPEKKFKTIHITGTNGKGSTTAMIASILTSAGIRTGMYTSPHLVDYTERMIIDGQEITKQDFADCIQYASRFVEEIVNDGLEHPTEFEVLTAAAFYYFAVNQVEYAVIEVGLGGLLDSTNVILPELSVITNVTLEHTDRCGSTLREIASHKAGIIKTGVPVLTAAEGDALAVIKETADKNKAPLFLWEKDFRGTFKGIVGGYQQVALEIESLGLKGNFTMGLVGRHQMINCGLAVMAVALVAQREAKITDQAIYDGLQRVCWPGRFEVVDGQPPIIIDGAHNPDGARVLRENLDLFYRDKKKVFLLGILKDKNVQGIINELIRPEDMVVVTTPASDRAADPESVAEKIQAKHVETEKNIENGLRRSKMLAGENALICVAGSLYLIGQVRPMICK